MIQSFIFDMDGTLFQTNKILGISLEDTFNHLRKMGLWDNVTPIEQYRKIMGVPLPKVWETLLPKHSNEIREQVNEFFHDKLICNIKSGKGELYLCTLAGVSRSGYYNYFSFESQESRKLKDKKDEAVKEIILKPSILKIVRKGHVKSK